MAKRGSNKDRSIKQETFIASSYGGYRNAMSGAHVTEKGDVVVVSDRTIFECKTTGEPGKEAKSTLVKRMEKIADEAWERGLEPALALQFFMPESSLATPDGFVNLTVRLTKDDIERGPNY